MMKMKLDINFGGFGMKTHAELDLNAELLNLNQSFNERKSQKENIVQLNFYEANELREWLNKNLPR